MHILIHAFQHLSPLQKQLTVVIGTEWRQCGHGLYPGQGVCCRRR
jgi:hypothetical protein